MNVPVCLENLVDLDNGRLKAAFDRSLLAAISDLKERPGDERARKIVLTVELKPRAGRDSSFEGAAIDYFITSKVPHEQGETTHLIAQPNAGALTLMMPTEGNNANQGRLFKKPADEE